MTRARRASEGATRWTSLVLALLLGLTLGLWVVERYGANTNMRVDVLEQQVQRVQALLSQRGVGKTHFSANCREPWRAVGAIAGGLWGCQAPEPANKDFHANCNLTRSAVARGTDPESYYKAAVAGSPQLTAAKLLGGETIDVHGRPAYQARFEHKLIGPPMRVLATVFVEGDRAYALNCTAPTATYDAYAAMFHEIAGSFEVSS